MTLVLTYFSGCFGFWRAKGNCSRQLCQCWSFLQNFRFRKKIFIPNWDWRLVLNRQLATRARPIHRYADVSYWKNAIILHRVFGSLSCYSHLWFINSKIPKLQLKIGKFWQ